MLLDGRGVASTEAILSTGVVTKIDGELAALKSLRESFKDRHPDQAFPGAVLLELDGATRGAVLMSLVQTAAYAGFPNISFVVDPLEPSGGAGRALIPIDAMIPTPPDLPSVAEPKLVIDASSPQEVVIGWLADADLVESARLPVDDQKAIEAHIADQWEAKGRHRAPDDRRLDLAVVEIGPSTDLSTLIRMLDALYTPKRQQSFDTARTTGPVFNVALGFSGWRTSRPLPTPVPAGPAGARLGALSARGQLPPEVISRILKTALPAYAACKDGNRKRTLLMHFEIGGGGAISSASVRSVADDDPVAVCAVGVTKRLNFPAPEKGTVTVDVPIELDP